MQSVRFRMLRVRSPTNDLARNPSLRVDTRQQSARQSAESSMTGFFKRNMQLLSGREEMREQMGHVGVRSFAATS